MCKENFDQVSIGRAARADLIGFSLMLTDNKNLLKIPDLSNSQVNLLDLTGCDALGPVAVSLQTIDLQ